MEFNKDVWDFMNNPDDPDFAKKYDDLIRAYIDNAEKNPDRFPIRNNVSRFKYLMQFPNWLYKIPLPSGTDYNDKKQVEKVRFACFMFYVKYINMFKDFNTVFGESEESYNKFINAYGKLLEAHQKGFFEEEQKKIERINSSPLLRMIFSITGAITGEKFVSKVQIAPSNKAKDEEKGDKNHGDGDPEL